MPETNMASQQQVRKKQGVIDPAGCLLRGLNVFDYDDVVDVMTKKLVLQSFLLEFKGKCWKYCGPC